MFFDWGKRDRETEKKLNKKKHLAYLVKHIGISMFYSLESKKQSSISVFAKTDVSLVSKSGCIVPSIGIEHLPSKE